MRYTVKNVLIVCKSMSIGGVEKSLVSLLHTLSPQEYEVDLLLLERSGGFLSQIPPWVHVMELEAYAELKETVNLPPITVIRKALRCGAVQKAVRLSAAYVLTKLKHDYRHYYRAAFRSVPHCPKQYDIAIAYSSIISYLTWYVCYHVSAKHKIGWIHFDVSQLQLDRKMLLALHSQLDKIFIVSEQGYQIFCKMFPSLAPKCEVRYNVIDRTSILQLAEEPIEEEIAQNHPIIMTLGRLEPEKGQDIIPEVADLLRTAGFRFTWYLIGDGSLRNPIQAEISRRALHNEVILLGTKSNPYPYLKLADLYVQTSIHEGYCITLAEARVFTDCIVSTDFTGAREQLSSSPHALIVKRFAAEIADAVSQLLKAPSANCPD